MAHITLPGHVTIQHRVSLPVLQRAHQLLNVMELLEKILSYLPPDALLALQGYVEGLRRRSRRLRACDEPYIALSNFTPAACIRLHSRHLCLTSG
ncbi:hypothetical protein LTR09_003782 [Extremus antarcticus]|uniref:Uncharacterized protein n=1 Tax=Extremus antarcticus TaxID=702011 RepID=A0AAJ0GE03_9PEZI|nr:hypothetical protein LTR09_003782 [Extremus antarcticus]